MNIRFFAWREVAGRPWRTLINALGVAIGVALVIALFSVTMAYRTAVTAPFTAAATDLTLSRPSRNAGAPAVTAKGVILPAASQAIHASEVERLARLPEAKATVGVLQIWCFDPGQFKVALGLAPDARAVGPAKARTWMKSGRFLKPGDKGVAVLESHFARFYGLKVGKPVTVGGRGFTIVGIYEVREGAQLTAANLYLPLADAQDLAGASRDTVNLVYLELKDARRWQQAISDISRHFPDLKATSADSALAVSDSLLALLNRLAWPAAILIIAMCLFFVYRSLAASTWERVAEFGTMKALGWRKRDIRHVLMLELFCQVSLGAAIEIGRASCRERV